MATILKANNSTALNLTGSWVGGVVPAATDVAQYDSTVTTATNVNLGAALSFLGFSVTNPGGSVQISTTNAALTLGASGIDLSSATQNLTFNSPVQISLGADQSWNIGSGRTLTSTSVISSVSTTRVLTKTGIGTLALSAANTWGGSGGGFVASAGLTTASNIGSFGSASNTVTVQSGAAISFTAIPNQTTFAVAGIGSASQLAAMQSTVAFAAGKTIAISGGDVALSFGLTASFAAKITGPSTGDVVLNFTSVATTASFSSTTTDFTVGSGKYVRIRSVNVTTGAGASASYVPGASEAGLGNAANKVFVESTASVNFPASTTVTVARNYKFEGEATSGGLASGKNWAIEVAGNASAIANFTGTIDGSGGTYVKVASSSSVPYGTAKFSGAFSGTWNLQGYAAGSTVSILSLDSALDVSGWTGNIDAALLTYGMSPGGAVTYGTSTTTLDSSTANLVVSHTSYARTGGTTVLFTGSNSLTLGPSGSSWSAAPGTWNVAASTLTLAFNFNGTTSTLVKNGAGTLVLSGNNAVGVTGVLWNVGNLTLNSNNSAGSTGSTFTVSSTGILDSTGATLTQTGTNALNGNFTWGGSGDLTFGAGNITFNASRTISFLLGKTGTLKFLGNLTTSTGNLLSIGGSPGSSRSRLWLVGTNALTGATNSVTAGYFRVSDAGGLGNATTTMWAVSSGAALELEGGISPTNARSVTITGPGPNTDGALRSVNGTSVWNGAIIPPVQSLASPTRIQVDAGTFTLATGLYTTISPTVSGTPLQFTALSSATLNQQRQLMATVSDVTVNNGGAGTVVFSTANSHTGGFTVEGGTAKVTNATATSTGTVQVNATATLESTVPSQFTTLRLGTNGSGSRAILKFAA